MRRLMRRSGVLVCAVLVTACAGGRIQQATDIAPSVSLADMAGTWNMQTLNMAADSVLVTYDIFATNDVSGWTLTFPGRDPIPVRVLEVAGDSVILDAGPYVSALQQGMTVSTRFDMELQGDSLAGLITAIYNLPEGPTTVPLRVRGRRAR
jgi:hypothetical protein